MNSHSAQEHRGQAVIRCTFCPSRPCPDPTKTGTVAQLGSSSLYNPPAPQPLILCMTSSTQVSLLPLPQDCLGDLALIPRKMAWLVVMRLELWVRRGCPPQLSFPGAYELPACASPASGTVPLAPADSCKAAWPCSDIVGGGTCGARTPPSAPGSALPEGTHHRTLPWHSVWPSVKP